MLKNELDQPFRLLQRLFSQSIRPRVTTYCAALLLLVGFPRCLVSFRHSLKGILSFLTAQVMTACDRCEQPRKAGRNAAVDVGLASCFGETNHDA